MALIKCEECGQLMSDKVNACPNCGCPNNARSSETEPIYSGPEDPDNGPEHNRGGGLKWLIIVIALLVVAGGALGYYIYSDNKGKEESADLAENARRDSIAAANDAEKARNDSLAAEIARLDSIRKDSIAWYNFTAPDLAFFELHGHVKSCRTTGYYSYASNFDRNGKLQNGSKYKRDKEGRIISESLQSDLMGNYTARYSWKNGRVALRIGEEENRGTYNYDSKGTLTSIKTVWPYGGEGVDEGEAEVTVYSNYKFDKMGNWISRTAKSKYDSHTEKRVIEYYDR